MFFVIKQHHLLSWSVSVQKDSGPAEISLPTAIGRKSQARHGTACMPVIPGMQLRQEDDELRDNLSYLVRPSLKKEINFFLNLIVQKRLLTVKCLALPFSNLILNSFELS